MTDKELLELAAKAIGITLDFTIRGDSPPYYVNGRGGHSSWNPLTDDGDALRLAYKLHINITNALNFSGAKPHFGGKGFDEPKSDDMSCVRLAIVRAAAEIGKAMP